MNAQHKRLFMQRFEVMKDAAFTHPYAKWMAVIDPSTDPACCELHGKVWQVKGSALSGTVAEHLTSNIKNCRCKLAPLRQSGQAEDELAFRAQQTVNRSIPKPTKKEQRRKAAIRQAVVESVAASNVRVATSLRSKESWIDRLKQKIGLK